MTREELLLAGLGILLAVAVFEAAARLYLVLHPAYDVVFLEPDSVLGWKQTPNLRFTWTGTYWYAADFSVEVQANSLGFRDVERTLARPPDTTRVVLLGDSMVEALQVPLEQTAAQLLERRLNAQSPSRRRFEVLNFGISNYSVGQYLLVWEQYASRFGARYVLAFVSPLQMRRTPEAWLEGRFRTTRGERLRARPTFELRDGELVRTLPADFEAFVAAHERLIREEFGGSRMRRRPLRLVGHSVIATLWSRLPGRRSAASGGAPAAAGKRAGVATPPGGLAPDLLALNLRILEELGGRVESAGARLVIVDATGSFDPQSRAAGRRLRGLSEEHGFGYIPLFAHIMQATGDGRRTSWRHDVHYNEEGNRVFADAMYRWLIRALRRHPSGASAAAAIEEGAG